MYKKIIRILVLTAGCVISLGIIMFGWRALQKTMRINRVAAQLVSFAAAFKKYEHDNGLLPADNFNVIPKGMEYYIDPNVWESDALGGHFNWEGPYWSERGNYDYAGIALFGTAATIKELIRLDRKIDDGNLATGKFRQTPNGRYTYVFEEKPSADWKGERR